MLDITLKETRVYRKIKEEGRSEGRSVMAKAISRQLTKRIGELSLANASSNFRLIITCSGRFERSVVRFYQCG